MKSAIIFSGNQNRVQNNKRVHIEESLRGKDNQYSKQRTITSASERNSESINSSQHKSTRPTNESEKENIKSQTFYFIKSGFPAKWYSLHSNVHFLI